MKKNVVKTIEILEGESIIDCLQIELINAVSEAIKAGEFTFGEKMTGDLGLEVKLNNADNVSCRAYKWGEIAISCDDTIRYEDEHEFYKAFKAEKKAREVAELKAKLAELEQ